MRKFFGTDGIRGLTNKVPMTAEVAMRVGMAAGAHFLRGGHKHRVVIGKDTRLSGYMLENALVAGFTSVGMDVVQVGPMPTPAVAMLTQSMRADLGVMISASHNPFHDNGIKLFGPDGYKLSDADEMQIEALLDAEPALAEPAHIGRAKRIEDARGRYIHAVKQSLPGSVRLDGLKLVLDCANGAAYNSAPTVFWELGADVVAIGVEPNGTNINDRCGSTAPALLQETVVASGADIGVALDGDADRLIVVDEKGSIVDGDQIMALIGASWARQGRLKGGGVVATVMSNVGGEQSGHMILSDHATTGDGTLAALQLLAELVRAGRPASELLHQFDPVPQLLKNVRFAGGKPLDAPTVQAAIAEGETMLDGRGRLVIRASGTEPVIRVMAEGDDAGEVEQVVDMICDAVRAAAAN